MVAPELAVHGIEGLRMVDASAIPRNLSRPRMRSAPFATITIAAAFVLMETIVRKETPVLHRYVVPATARGGVV
ncbi:hypothetical protein ABT010_31405 [Streptomyces sp. NPDC002668]|uniref:hypothetical protein n=1 Tax=Streptomyces sp. NPDC002668 TaxID=3154422 RepID=UPI0033297D06